ncbi:MAG: hypothetical protein NTX91_00965 [candidate division SR1 bacterium]|nr:hypothetical protein [candidate division SR1 bacterium]
MFRISENDGRIPENGERIPEKDQKIPENVYKKSLKMKSGDLLQLGSEYFLCLGKKISFEELYLKMEELKNGNMEICYKGFLSKETMALLHRMVETYYTTYKSVVKHFVTDELQKLLEREGKIKDKRGKTKDESPRKSLNFNLGSFICSSQGQTLVVFPDLRTLTNGGLKMDDLPAGRQGGGGLVTLLASQTEKQKDVHRWEIKKGMQSVILCTYAEIFQD